MAWIEGHHTKELKECDQTNKKIAELEGEISLDLAQECLVEYLQANPYFAINLLTGFEIYEFQDLLIRGLWQKDFSLFVASRGLGKTTVASWFAMLYAIFNPNIKIGVCSATFRQSRTIFKNIEDWAYHKKGLYLRQCFKGKPKHNADAWIMEFSNGSSIIALPLGAADRIRGYRFNVMIIDELLLLSDKVINEVIRPFMAIQADPVMRQKVREAEDKLIAAGEMDKDDRYVFPSNKMIGLTSASYKFEYLYKLYSDYKELILDENAEHVSHAIFQMAYDIAPEGLYDAKNVSDAKKSSSAAQFAREYMAQFTDDSSGYFSAKKMENATFKAGEAPHTKLAGDKSVKYILGIDPNYDDAESSDHFAMCLLELDTDSKKGTVVHNYALSKSNLKDRALYLNYLLNFFNIDYIICDKAGGVSFINDIETLGLVEKKVKFFDHDFDNENYVEGVLKSKAEYNANIGKIVHAQYFNPKWIRSANELLQANIEHSRLRFASKAGQYEGFYDKEMGHKIPILDLDFSDEVEKNNPSLKQSDFLEVQDSLMDLLKRECALIEIATTSTGHQRFDLPQALLRDKSPDRARKDSYSALLLANWGMKCYFDMIGTLGPKMPESTFIPRFIA